MAKPFTLTQLRYFAVVAELESMTAAAARLLVTQSTLSTAMAQLEASLGTQLFVRQGGLSLTAGGRRLAKDLKGFLEQADLLYESARDMSAELVGELSVGVFSPLAPFRLPVILQAFENNYPGVAVSILEADLATLQKALLDGQCEVALTYNLGLSRGFSHQVLERVPPHVLVAADHPAAQRREREISLRELEPEPMIMLDLPHSREYYQSLFVLAGVTPYVRHRFSGYETVRSFVATGHGYSVLNQRLFSDATYAGDPVVALRLTDDFPPIEVMLVRAEGVRPTRRALAFEETCRRQYGMMGR